MTAPEYVYFWRGRPLEELTRDELIEAVKELGHLYKQEMDNHMESHAFYRSLREAKP